MTRPLRIASWNIHGAVGRDRRCDPERIARAITSFDADVVALQEIDGRTRLGRRAQAFETMAALLGPNVVEARLVGPPGREHGNLLWSRWPIRRSCVRLLPGGFEQRGLIDAEIDCIGGPLRVLAAHFSLGPWTRRAQARIAAGLVDGDRATPTILLGDLNEWHPRGAVHRIVTGRLPVSLLRPTFPARRPIAALDRIYASAEFELTALEPQVELSDASDHLPVIFEVRRR